MRRSGKTLTAVLAGLGLAHAAGAQPADSPELDFLEYLGSWQEGDEEWEIVAEWEDEDGVSTPKAPEREDEDND